VQQLQGAWLLQAQWDATKANGQEVTVWNRQRLQCQPFGSSKHVKFGPFQLLICAAANCSADAAATHVLLLCQQPYMQHCLREL
jgi:hypothetical protein